MKRDMDLIRAILLQVEDSEKDFVRFDSPEEAFHIALLKEAGYVVAHVEEPIGQLPKMANVKRLTWAGHEFLEAMRDDTIWDKAKAKLLKPGVSWTLTLLLKYLEAEARTKLGLPIP